MDLSLDALCEDLQSCFDPDPEATAKATNLVAAQVGVQLSTHAALQNPTLEILCLSLQVEETVLSELESLATEVIQEAQVSTSYPYFVEP